MNIYKSQIFALAFLLAFPILLSAQEARFPLHEVYFQHDNDVFRLVERTDQYYSFGILGGYAKILQNAHWLNSLIAFLPWNAEEKRLFTLDYALKGYTPEFEKDTILVPKRPFAGVSVFQIGIQSSKFKRVIAIGITLGVRGPASGAKTVQDNFHRLIGESIFEGWSTQLPNKFLYGIKADYARSLKLSSWNDMVSVTRLAIGNYQTHLDQRVSLRVGKVRPLHHTVVCQNYLGEYFDKPEIYLSATLIGRVVGVDTTFGKLGEEKNNPFTPNKSNLLAGYELAFHYQENRFGLFIAHNRISSESTFSTKHSYGSLGLSYSF